MLSLAETMHSSIMKPVYLLLMISAALEKVVMQFNLISGTLLKQKLTVQVWLGANLGQFHSNISGHTPLHGVSELLILHLLVDGVQVSTGQLLGEVHQLLLGCAQLLQDVLLTGWVKFGLQNMSLRLWAKRE
jgi:hypothetical protein